MGSWRLASSTPEGLVFLLPQTVVPYDQTYSLVVGIFQGAKKLDNASGAEGNLDASKYIVNSHLVADEDAIAKPALQRPRRWPYVATIVVLAVGLLTFGAGYFYSTNSAEQWRASSDKAARDLDYMKAVRDDLTQKNSTLASQLADTTKQLNDATKQLSSSNERVRSLANEKAQIGDTAAVLTTLVANSQKVTSETAVCIHAHQDLESFLGGPRPYDHAAWQSRSTSVDSVCEVAYKDATSLTGAIQGLGR